MTLLGMHMANELLSTPMAGITLVLAAGIVAFCLFRIRRLEPRKLTLMGVMGAFVFAAQMINITLPGMPGTSGHLGGGVLLAILLGPAAAIVTLAAILLVQSLLFFDGGLLALGCNIINMSVIPALLGWGVYRVILGSVAKAGAVRQYFAAWAACVLGVAGGAALVPIQAGLSGVLRLPLGQFLAVMVGVHLLIGFVEGMITFAVVAYLRQVRPDAVGLDEAATQAKLSPRMVAGSLLMTAVLLAGVLSWFASPYADGLEWSYLERDYGRSGPSVENPDSAAASMDQWQAKYSPLTDYSKRPAAFGDVPTEEDTPETSETVGGAASDESQDEAAEGAWPAVDGWGSLAGLIGTAVTLLLLWTLARLLRKPDRSQPIAQA
jgi:cobalt/nickel transport system permease protein